MPGPTLSTPLAAGYAVHGEQGGTGLDVSQQTGGYALVVAPDSKSWQASPFIAPGAGQVIAISTKTADYVITTNDATILVDVTAGNKTFTLPLASSCAGQIFTMKKVDATANTATLIGAQTIDGMVSYPINSQYAAVTVQSNGVAWSILNEKF